MHCSKVLGWRHVCLPITLNIWCNGFQLYHPWYQSIICIFTEPWVKAPQHFMFFGELVVWCCWSCDWKVYRDFKTQDSLSLMNVRALRTQKKNLCAATNGENGHPWFNSQRNSAIGPLKRPIKDFSELSLRKKQERSLLLDPRNKHILTMEHNRRQWFESVSLQVKWRCDD